MYISSFYRPHESDRNSLEELKKSLEQVCNHTGSHVWMGGDFNFPGYNWTQKIIKPSCSQPELTRSFIDIIADNGLTQVVQEPTFYENTLDLFLFPKFIALKSYLAYPETAITQCTWNSVFL